jgi:hypothetical protein
VSKSTPRAVTVTPRTVAVVTLTIAFVAIAVPIAIRHSTASCVVLFFVMVLVTLFGFVVSTIHSFPPTTGTSPHRSGSGGHARFGLVPARVEVPSPQARRRATTAEAGRQQRGR